MLVLSRKSEENIVFPALGITIRILRTAANSVKIGIEAPSRWKVRRGERLNCRDLIEAVIDLKQSIESHELRNRLNTLVLQLEFLQRLEDRELNDEGVELIRRASLALTNLDSEMQRLAIPLDPDSGSALSSRRLLVVDDDQNERELLSATLTLQGFQVDAVSDGVMALDCLNSKNVLPHAVLMDIDMPNMRGDAALRCIRSDHRFSSLKVIAISGCDSVQVQLADDQRSFDAWFTKPLQLRSLIQLIDEAVKKAESL